MPSSAAITMTTRACSALLLLLALTACNSRPTLPTAPTATGETDGLRAASASVKGDPGYTAYVSGSTTDVQTTPLGGALLAGGGTDSDAGMKWPRRLSSRSAISARGPLRKTSCSSSACDRRMSR